jgi:PTS system nitrogen regulatory IIA component
MALPFRMGASKALKRPWLRSFSWRSPSDFDAPDELAVNLLIFLLVPEAATQKHLEILSEIAEMLSDVSLREKLVSSQDAAELYGLISSWRSAQLA